MPKVLSFRQAFSVIASGSLVLTLAGCGAVAAKGPTVSDAALVKAWHVPSNRVWMHPTVLTAATRPMVSALPNQASSDAYMWKRADGAITLWGGVPGTRTRELLDLKPGQTLTIGGNWLNAQMPGSANNVPMSIAVNAPPATWSAVSIPWQDGAKTTVSPSQHMGLSPNQVQFVARKPGVYTIQALWDGHWSLPLVVTVGLSTLRAPAWPISGTQWTVTRNVDVASLTRDSLSAAWSQHRKVITALKHASLHVGHPVNGWLPVWGKVPLSAIHAGFARSLTLKQTWSGAWDGTHAWTATLPIGSNGEFHGIMRLLVHGKTNVTMELNQLTGSAAAEKAHPNPTVWIRSAVFNATATVNTETGYLASAADMNTESPAIATLGRESRALLANSGSWTSGLVAVATLASESVTYNSLYDKEPYGAHNESLQQVVASHQAICVGYASLTSALFRLASIPTTIVVGSWAYAHASPTWNLTQMRSADVGGAHVWVRVDGLNLDPTGIAGPTAGWEQFDGGVISSSSAFAWAYHEFATAPDNGAVNYQSLMKYAPQ